MARRGTVVWAAALCGCAASRGPVAGEAPQPATGPRVDPERLTFEADGDFAGWYAGPPGTAALDSAVKHSGTRSGRLQRAGGAPTGPSVFSVRIPIDFVGEELALHGWLKVEDVTGFAGLWLRLDGPGGALALENMHGRGLAGTRDWARFTVRLPVLPEARQLVFGAMLAGTGTAWVDDLELEVDGEPIDAAPARPLPALAPRWTRDPAFASGSGVAFPAAPSPEQVADLVLLGRVWGFVKHHHPRVAGGEVNWDEALFRVLPDVLASPGPDETRARLDGWVAALGEPEPCDPCAALPPADAVQLAPDLDWLADTALLGAELSARLQRIRTARRRADADPPQTWVSLAEGVGNPVFSEASYPGALPDAGIRLLAVYRTWTAFGTWFPYRDQLDEDWVDVLADTIPEAIAADTRDACARSLIRMVARATDTHANLWSALDARPPQGRAGLPVDLQHVEGRPVVRGFTRPEGAEATGLQVGDVILALDGRPVDGVLAERAPWYAASNGPTRMRDLVRALTWGAPGPITLEVDRAGADAPVTVRTERIARIGADERANRSHDHAEGPPLRRLSDSIAYLTLSSVVAADVPRYLAGAEGAELLLIDLRTYPSEFVVFALGRHLVAEDTPFAQFTIADLENPGAFLWGAPIVLEPLAPRFEGRIAILVDETTQSQAEYTTMAFRTAPGAIVVGSTTAGADGNLSTLPLPGGLSVGMSGIGVFAPDRQRTQRIGIVADVEARPTVAGIRAGRDEVLEAAVRAVLGRDPTAAELAALTPGPPVARDP